MGWMGRNGAGWLGKKRELGRWRRKKKRMTGHVRAELRVHIGAFSNFYIAFVAAPTPRITCFIPNREERGPIFNTFKTSYII